jgi:hypothetical protein
MQGTKDMTEERVVRRYIRRRDTHEYFKGDGWTPNPNEALNIADAVEAAEICVRHNLTGVELTMRVSAESHDVFCTPIR